MLYFNYSATISLNKKWFINNLLLMSNILNTCVYILFYFLRYFKLEFRNCLDN